MRMSKTIHNRRSRKSTQRCLYRRQPNRAFWSNRFSMFCRLIWLPRQDQCLKLFMSETYAAMAVGLRPDLRVILPSYDDDYHGEQRLELHDVPYRIERAYRADDGTAELTVSRLKGGGVIPGVGY